MQIKTKTNDQGTTLTRPLANFEFQLENIGFSNGPVFRYGNFFNPLDEEIFIPENNGPFRNCIPVWVNQAKNLCHCNIKKKSDFRIGHVEIRFLCTGAMAISQIFLKGMEIYEWSTLILTRRNRYCNISGLFQDCLEKQNLQIAFRSQNSWSA